MGRKPRVDRSPEEKWQIVQEGIKSGNVSETCRRYLTIIRPEMARLTLARKIATIVLIVWKKGVCFDAQHLKPQTA
jgi:hypothetical protein